MINKFLLSGFLLGGLFINAQTINETYAKTKKDGKIGINTDVPTRTLTIKNSTDNTGRPPLRNDATGPTEKVNGTWIITLLIAPKEVVNYIEIEQDLRGSNRGAVSGEASTKLNRLLNQISQY